MLPVSALKNMNVLWATPCYISAVSMNYVTSFFQLTHRSIELNLKSTVHMRSESLITRARNEIVKFFLMNEQFTHLFWIDSDISFSPEAAIRLLLSDHDIAAGIYPLKNLNWPAEGLPAGMTKEAFEIQYTNYPFNPIGFGSRPIAEFAEVDNFIEVAEAPTGFMCIKRSVFYRMMQKYPYLNYVPDGPPNNPEARYYWLFFDCMVDPDSGRYLSEDYAFCRRWRDMGGKVYADLDSRLGHLGQHMYGGNLAESLHVRGR